eukprot:1100595-Rhodomonas_salina.4
MAGRFSLCTFDRGSTPLWRYARATRCAGTEIGYGATSPDFRPAMNGEEWARYGQCAQVAYLPTRVLCDARY